MINAYQFGGASQQLSFNTFYKNVDLFAPGHLSYTEVICLYEKITKSSGECDTQLGDSSVEFEQFLSPEFINRLDETKLYLRTESVQSDLDRERINTSIKMVNHMKNVILLKLNPPVSISQDAEKALELAERLMGK